MRRDLFQSFGLSVCKPAYICSATIVLNFFYQDAYSNDSCLMFLSLGLNGRIIHRFRDFLEYQAMGSYE